LNAYLAVFIGKMKVLLQYKEAALAGIATQIFWGVIRILILLAFYRSTVSPQPISFPEVVTYIWLSQATFRLVPISVDSDIAIMIRTGTVGYELVRPLDLYYFWFCRTMAGKLAPTLLRFFPVVVISGLFLGLKPPATWFAFFSWLLLTILALFLSSAITNLMNISMLWTVAGDGISNLFMSSTYLLSGQMIPLTLFPEFTKRFILSLPFAGMVDLPIQFYLGRKTLPELSGAIFFQLVWLVGFLLVGRLILRVGLKRMIVQGG
jgi:ABC-2 type transport system permease protein